ncbi:MAG: hypothetical protein ACK5ES_22570 [Planctomyces sp.]|jgi:hypothetical protein
MPADPENPFAVESTTNHSRPGSLWRWCVGMTARGLALVFLISSIPLGFRSGSLAVPIITIAIAAMLWFTGRSFAAGGFSGGTFQADDAP